MNERKQGSYMERSFEIAADVSLGLPDRVRTGEEGDRPAIGFAARIPPAILRTFGPYTNRPGAKRFEDLRVRIYGDVAIATGIDHTVRIRIAN